MEINISKAVADNVAWIIRHVRREIEGALREKGLRAIEKAKDAAHAAVMAAPAETDWAAYRKAEKEGELAISAAKEAAEKELTDTLAGLDSADPEAKWAVLPLLLAESRWNIGDVADRIKAKVLLREAGIVVDGPTATDANVREQVGKKASALARDVYEAALRLANGGAA
jgi:hypothetical protein